ncbi:MlaD family protein [Conexibacter sp. SYSU D00693]|uniref:MlaD family protein n=1 Tax=Conexibacter sp. SYSU D00693 TaxID=2812560 RepID=UPI00196ABB3D|nr:MlaD family protein [Conexibacter sp. SYSU D00693]
MPGRPRPVLRRIVPLATLLVLAAVAVVVLVGGQDDYRLKLRFENASQLVKGDEVKVGGVGVGTVDAIRLDDDNLAEVDVTITDGDLTPLHEGTRAEVRVASLSSVANRFVQLAPGPNSNPELDSGAVLPASASRSVVEIDSVLSTLDTQTRSAAQDLLRNQRAVFEGQEGEANKGLTALSPALGQLDLLAREVNRDSRAFQQFLVQSASVVGAVASRDRDLEAALGGAASTARELADQRAALTGVLRRAPGTLAEGTRTLRDLGTTFTALRPAARELQPVAPRAAALVRELQPLLQRSGPAIDDVRALLPDLTSTLQDMPGLRTTALPAFDATTKAVDDVLPIVSKALPYLPDVFHGVVSGFGASQVNSYDANGLYGRVAPIANNLSLSGGLSALGGALPLARKGNVRRCPGGAYREIPGVGNNQVPEGGSCDPGNAP